MLPGSSAWLVLGRGVLAAASNVVGGWLALKQPPISRRFSVLGFAFSGGFLLAVTLLLILPECMRMAPSAPAMIVAGYFLVHLAEHAYAGHAHHVSAQPHGSHPLIGHHGHGDRRIPISPAAAGAATAGLLLHSFFDGAAIAAALAAGSRVGWFAFFAVVFHKVPEGFSLATIVVSSGRSRRAASNTVTALAAASLAGTATVLIAAQSVLGLEPLFLGIACGMFLHIAATDLLPATSHVRGLSVLIATLAGAVAVVLAEGLLNLAGL